MPQALRLASKGHMSLAELTVDLLFKICDGLDEESARSFAASSAWHGAVLTGWSQWRAKLSQSVEGTIGRPRLLRPNERNNERVVSYCDHSCAQTSFCVEIGVGRQVAVAGVSSMGDTLT